MALDLRNPGHAKLSLLCEGVDILPDATQELGTKFTEWTNSYNNSSQKLKEGIKVIPEEFTLPENVVCGVRYRPSSPWKMHFDKSKYYLTYDGEYICDINLPPRPEFYSKTLSNGDPVLRYVTAYSVYAIGIFLNRQCHLWTDKMPCAFCSIAPTTNNFHSSHDAPPHDKIIEAIKVVQECDPRFDYLEISSGSLSDYDRGFTEAMDLVRKLKPFLKKEMKIHTLVQPPKDFELLKMLDIVDEPTFAMEVWDPEYFNEIVPGKEHFYGREKYIEIFKEGTRLFGKGKFSCQFIAGLEPLESLIEGIYKVAELGAVPQQAVFHPDLGTKLANKEPPSLEFEIEVIKTLRDVYKKYNYRPYRYTCRRSSPDGEAYMGYFDDL